MDEINTILQNLGERISAMEEGQRHLEESIASIKTTTEELAAYANFFRGGFWVLIGISGAFMTIVNSWERIKHFFRG